MLFRKINHIFLLRPFAERAGERLREGGEREEEKRRPERGRERKRNEETMPILDFSFSSAYLGHFF